MSGGILDPRVGQQAPAVIPEHQAARSQQPGSARAARRPG